MPKYIALQMGFVGGKRIRVGEEFEIAGPAPKWAAAKGDVDIRATGKPVRKTNGDTKPADAAKAAKVKAEGFSQG